MEKFKAALETENIAAYPKLSAKKIAALDEALATRIPEIVRKLNEAIFRAQSGEEKPNDNLNPFSTEALDSEWVRCNTNEMDPLSRPNNIDCDEGR